jgi:PAS domain S-box-containing protein
MLSALIHILVVDDEPDLCRLTKEFLEMDGQMIVQVAYSVKEAKEALDKNRYDAIVFDYQMPDGDGIRFLRSLREAGDKTPFILFTGKGKEEVIIEAWNNGADAYLQKGGEPEIQYAELKDRIISLVRRHQTEEALRESETKLQRAEEVTGFGHWQIDLDKNVIIWSHGSMTICGLEIPSLSLSDWQKIPLPEYRSHRDKALKDLVGSGIPYDVEFKMRRPIDGRIVDVHSLAQYDGRKNMVFGVLQDVTERHDFESHLQRTNRELLAIKECDRTLVKTQSEQELLDEVCRIVCDIAGYRMAWIGMAEHDEARSVRPVAWAGHENGYVAQIKATWSDDERGWGPTGMSIRTWSTVFCQDFADDSRTSPWRDLALSNGYRSSIAVPLLDPNGAFGSFTLYSERINGFTEDEVQLLEELTSDVAYGIVSLRAREERRRAEEALKESEEHFRNLSENAFEGIAISIKGMIVDANNALPEILQYRPDDLIGMSIFDFLTPESSRLAREKVDEMASGPFEVQMIRKNGDTLTLRLKEKDIPWKGRIARLSAFQDITDRKKAEDALKESVEKARQHAEEIETLMDVVPAAIWVAHDKDCRVITGNQSGSAFYGSDDADVSNDPNTGNEGNGSMRFFRNGIELRPEELPIQEAALKGLEVRDSEIEVLLPSGRKIVMLGNARPLLNESGRVRGSVASFLNITDRKMIEENLKRSNAELQQFAYVASHDLQEPLRTVTSHLSLLERKHGDQLDDDAKEYLRYAVDGGLRARELVRDLLDYSRIESRAEPIKPTDMEKVLATVEGNLRTQITEARATITHDPLPFIVADGRQMEALIQNLISNAIKFHGHDDPIVHVSALNDDNALTFSIRDNGIGIEQKYREKIFQIFQRLHTADQYPGTGIGLAIVKKIVDRHGGKIWFDSEPGKGTTFYFTISKK